LVDTQAQFVDTQAWLVDTQTQSVDTQLKNAQSGRRHMTDQTLSDIKNSMKEEFTACSGNLILRHFQKKNSGKSGKLHAAQSLPDLRSWVQIPIWSPFSRRDL
jgi:hypothetical protein